MGDGALHGGGEGLEVAHVYDGAVRADQFEDGEGFVGGGGERFSQKTGLPMGMTDCSRAR